jgi:hypothetical protein
LKIKYRSRRCYGACWMAHFFIIPYVQTKSNRLCRFHVFLLWLMLPRDHPLSITIFFTKVGVKCRVAAAKNCPILHFSVVQFSGNSALLIQALLSVEHWVPLLVRYHFFIIPHAQTHLMLPIDQTLSWFVHFPVPFMNRLNQNELATFFNFVRSLWIPFFSSLVTWGMRRNDTTSDVML